MTNSLFIKYTYPSFCIFSSEAQHTFTLRRVFLSPVSCLSEVIFSDHTLESKERKRNDDEAQSPKLPDGQLRISYVPSNGKLEPLF